MSMSIIKNIQFMTDDGNSTHVISIEDARKLYEELHELFGPTPVAVAPSEPYNPLKPQNRSPNDNMTLIGPSDSIRDSMRTTSPLTSSWPDHTHN